MKKGGEVWRCGRYGGGCVFRTLKSRTGYSASSQRGSRCCLSREQRRGTGDGEGSRGRPTLSVTMALALPKHKSPVMEAVEGFVLGAIAGTALGITEEPVNMARNQIVAGKLLVPLTNAVRDVGPLGLGTLLGAIALTAAMTTTVMGVTTAASVGLAYLETRREPRATPREKLAWVGAGLSAAVCGSALSGATLGFVTEKVAASFGAAGLLCALVAFTAAKPALRLALPRRKPPVQAEAPWRGALEDEQVHRVTVDIEQAAGPRPSRWADRRREAEERGRREGKRTAVGTEQDKVNKALLKYLNFLAFSGIPMTVTATVTTAFGFFGFGEYRFVFVVLFTLVLAITFALMKCTHVKFWVLAGCMGMFATFAVAVLTVHAGQELVELAARIQLAGRRVSTETMSARIHHRSTLEALAAAFLVAKMCQVGLGATVGGPLGREVNSRIVVGAAGAVVVVVSLLNALSSVLGVGGTAGVLLGAVGTAGVSLGSAAALAMGCVTWTGRVATTAGSILGVLYFGTWSVVNLIQVAIGFAFALTSPY
ncbi:uncharacterized protein LOC114791075 [Denticeps clupeoides]|uniref:uncharacterized protein LOC114791075 n=1 Tax=Denticeps clupeoides TaxID=299321 RepID=UPI0010A2CE14|nr:uncharacterized protein LOC114791075 [Denticeps clupeoides]